MARNIFGEIRRIIEEQTSKIGSVSNLHGVIDVPDVQSREAKNQEWSIAQLSITRMPSLFEALDRITFDRPPIEEAAGNAVGTISWPQAGVRTGNNAVIFMTLARVPSNMKVPFQAVSEGASLDLYIDSVRVATGVDRISTQVPLSAGDHSVQVIAHGGNRAVSVSVAKYIECVRADVVPSAPIWVGSPEVFELDPVRAGIVVRLTWRNDSIATSWEIYRTQAVTLAAIDTVTDNADGSFTVKVYGTFDLLEGDLVFTKYWIAGTIIGIVEGSDVGGAFVEYEVARHEDSESLASDWEALDLMCEGDYHGIATINYAGTQELVFDDRAISPDKTYIYKATSFGLFSTTESDFSLPAVVFTNDEVPPDGVDWLETPVIEVKGDQIHVDYISPEDPDFEGVHVYGPYALSGGLLDPPAVFAPNMRVYTDFGEPNDTGEQKRDQFNFTAVKDSEGSYIEGGYFFATFDALGNEQSADVAFGYIFEGTSEAVTASNTISIEFDVNEISEVQHQLVINVFPRFDELGSPVTFVGYVNGVEVNSGTTPALTEILPAPADYRVYSITLTRLEGEDLRFIGTADGAGLRPQTTFYYMDEDPFAGLSGVHVEDKKSNPVVYAVMDDDAKYIRILEAPYVVPGNVLYTATKQPGTDVPGTIDYNTAIMTYTHADTLATDEVVSLRIDASKDGTNWNTDLWRGTIQGPSPQTVTVKPPSISIEGFVWQGTPSFGNYPEFRITVRATNPNGATQRVRLKWQTLEDNLAWSAITSISGSSGTVTSAVGSNTITRNITFNRFTTPAADKTIKLYAETISGEFISTEIVYTADFDATPEVVSAAAYPNPTSGQQTGWRIVGAVDDDTDLISFSAADVAGAVSGSHGITNIPANQAAGSGGNKVFDVIVTQPAGRIGNLLITPSKNGVAGAPYTVTLKRSPVTSIRIEDIDAAKFNVILTSSPESATKWLRSYLVGQTPPSFVQYSPPVSYYRNATLDRIIEFYSEANGLVEEVQSLTVDTDDLAELGAWTVTLEDNVVTVTVFPDDDSARWKCYAKKGEDPGSDEDYLRFDGTKNKTSVAFYVAGNDNGTDATWYFRVAGISWAGDINLHDYQTILVSGLPSAPPADDSPALRSVGVSVQKNSFKHVLHWTTNVAGDGSTVIINWERTVTPPAVPESGQFQGVTGDVGLSVPGGTYEHLAIPFDDNGDWHTYKYTFKIFGTTTTHIVQHSDYYGT